MKRPTRADPAAVTRRFVDLASALLTYLIEWLILRREAPSFWLARGLFGARPARSLVRRSNSTKSHSSMPIGEKRHRRPPCPTVIQVSGFVGSSEFHDHRPQPRRGVQMAHSIQAHLLRPGIDRRLVKLTGMGLADN